MTKSAINCWGSRVAAATLLTAVPLQGQAVAGRPAPELTFDGDSVELHMPNTRGRSLVQLRIGASPAYDFFIDTGAGVSVVDSHIAAELDLEVVGSQSIGAPGGDQVEADRVMLPPIVVDGLEISGATALVLDIAEMTNGAMEGILGMDIFQDVLLSLDPGTSKAIVSRGALVRGGPGVVETRYDGRGQMTFPIDVAGRTVRAHIDHGSPATFTLGVELIEELPTVAESEARGSAGMVGGSRTVRSRTLDGAVSFAGMRFPQPRVGFMDPSPGSANIGSGILDGLVVTLDPRNSLMAFRGSDHATASTAGPQRRIMRQGTQSPASGAGRRTLGLQFRGMGGGGFREIVSVADGSLSQRAGLRAGDEVLSLNGRPMPEYDQQSLMTLIAGSEALRWEITRNGERMVIVIG